MQPARKPDRQEETGDAILTTIYSELIEAAGAEFLPQAEGEPDGHYLRRLVLAVSKASDNDWEHLSKEAQDWYNAQAKRVKAHQDPEHCPGFGILDGHDGPVDNDSYKAAEPSEPIVDAVIDAGWPTGPELPKASSNDVAHQDSQIDAVIDTGINAAMDCDFLICPELPKRTATDAVRAIVMQHQDWNQAQIMRELESQGRVVSHGTIATVRSMTLATIAVAKGLGKWVE
jgi:hypothetical protein